MWRTGDIAERRSRRRKRRGRKRNRRRRRRRGGCIDRLLNGGIVGAVAEAREELEELALLLHLTHHRSGQNFKAELLSPDASVHLQGGI